MWDALAFDSLVHSNFCTWLYLPAFILIFSFSPTLPHSSEFESLRATIKPSLNRANSNLRAQAYAPAIEWIRIRLHLTVFEIMWMFAQLSEFESSCATKVPRIQANSNLFERLHPHTLERIRIFARDYILSFWRNGTVCKKLHLPTCVRIWISASDYTLLHWREFKASGESTSSSTTANSNIRAQLLTQKTHSSEVDPLQAIWIRVNSSLCKWLQPPKFGRIWIFALNHALP